MMKKMKIRSLAIALCVSGLITGSGSGLMAKNYYVAPSGNDNNSGTIDMPWGTWQKAFNTAQAGDTVYFRGGTWYPTTHADGGYPITKIDPNSGFGHNGTNSKPVCFFNYPGEIPILDCNHANFSNTGNIGLNINNATHIKFKGLTIRNVRMLTQDDNCSGIEMTKCGNITLENMSIHDIGGAGYWLAGYDTLYLKNCDAYNCCDSLDPYAPGGDGDGYNITSGGADLDTFRVAYITGCRAWHVSDDGFDISSTKQLYISHCWAFDNGYLKGDATGFKFSYSNVLDTRKRVIDHSIAAYNSAAFSTCNLVDSYYGARFLYYNNVSFECGTGFNTAPDAFNCTTGKAREVFQNNLIYDHAGTYYSLFTVCYSCGKSYNPYITLDHNNWTISEEWPYYKLTTSFSVTDDDFMSLDTAQLRFPRKSDGSLPDIDFMKPQEGSDLIDAGIDVGLSYEGTSPDIGAYEFGGVMVESDNGSDQIITNKGTLQLIATILDSKNAGKGVIWSIANYTGSATINPNGVVTAQGNGKVTARATLNDGSGISGSFVITISNQSVLVTSINVISAGGATTVSSKTLQLYTNILPTYASNKNVKWSIQNGTGKATVSSTGLVTAQSIGTVTVIATATDGSGVYGVINLQVTLKINTGIDDTEQAKIIVTCDSYNVTINVPTDAGYTHASLVNLNGQMIETRPITDDITTLDVSSLPTAVYLVMLKNKNGSLKSIKVLKH
jgi:hypothetical protein